LISNFLIFHEDLFKFSGSKISSAWTQVSCINAATTPETPVGSIALKTSNVFLKTAILAALLSIAAVEEESLAGYPTSYTAAYKIYAPAKTFSRWNFLKNSL